MLGGIGNPHRLAAAPAWQRPTGNITVPTSGQVWPTARYEDLYVSGDPDLQTVLDRMTFDAVATFPADLFDGSANPGFAEFKYGFQDALRMGDPSIFAHHCKGLAGSGIGQTIFKPTPNSNAAHAAIMNPSSGTNECYMFNFVGASSYLGGFDMIGTDQSVSGVGGYYNGIMLQGVNSYAQQLRLLAPHRGWKNAPPGENGGIRQNATGVRLDNVEVDGRDWSSGSAGARVASSPVMVNNVATSIWNQCNLHHSLTGMPTFYGVSGSILTNYLSSLFNGTSSGTLNGNGINHEECLASVINHNHPVINIDRGSGNTGLHITTQSDLGDMPNLNMLEPVWDASAPQGLFSVERSASYGSGQAVTSMPKITKNGAMMTGHDYPATLPNPLTDFLRYP